MTADIDLGHMIEQKEIHDILGYYNRFDVFKLEVNKTPQKPLWKSGMIAEGESGMLEKTSVKGVRRRSTKRLNGMFLH